MLTLERFFEKCLQPYDMGQEVSQSWFSLPGKALPNIHFGGANNIQIKKKKKIVGKCFMV